jgi:hypothetical protein
MEPDLLGPSGPGKSSFSKSEYSTKPLNFAHLATEDETTEEIVMKHCSAGLLAAITLATSVHAQQPQIGSYNPPVVNPRPVISPYLNLNRTGVNPAINYFGIVRPQMENHQAIQQLQQQYQATQGMIQTQTGALANEEMAPTGRAVGGYFNYSHYFPLYARGGAGTTGTSKR